MYNKYIILLSQWVTLNAAPCKIAINRLGGRMTKRETRGKEVSISVTVSLRKCNTSTLHIFFRITEHTTSNTQSNVTRTAQQCFELIDS